MSGVKLRTERDGRVLVVTIDRPEARNALDKAGQDGLHAAFDAFARNDDQWVAVITAAGDKVFCAGHDLKSPAPEGPADLPPSGFGGLTARFNLDKPVIAAVNGMALGGGFEMVLACDIVVASDTASFALPEAWVGLAALGGGVLRLTRLIGHQRAMGMIMTGRCATAQEGLSLGFVNAIHPQVDLMGAALTWADDIIAASPLAVRASKQVATRLTSADLAEASLQQWAVPAVTRMQASDDRREGMTAFVEKRRPVWSGT